MLGRLKFVISPLVNQMLDRLPRDVWTSETTTFFDPSIGGGQFVREIERRLLAVGHSQENVQTRVYGLAEDKLSLHYAVRNLIGTYRIGSIEGMSKQFDVIVGNPPYQDATMGKHKSSPLWIRIVGKSHELLKNGGYLAMVTPSSWMSPSKAFDAIFSKDDLQSVDLTAKRHFNVGSTFSAWVLRKAPATRKTLFITADGENTIDWSGMRFLPHIVTPTTVSLMRKFFFREGPTFTMERNDETDTRTLSKERTNEFKFRVFHTNAQTELWAKKKNSNHDIPKVMMTLSGYQIPVYSDDCGTSQIVIYVKVKSAAEGKRVMRILSSKLYNVMIETLGKYGNAWGLNRVLFSLPAVARDRDWTDEDLYTHFGLTKVEIAYIEEHAK